MSIDDAIERARKQAAANESHQAALAATAAQQHQRARWLLQQLGNEAVARLHTAGITPQAAGRVKPPIERDWRTTGKWTYEVPRGWRFRTPFHRPPIVLTPDDVFLGLCITRPPTGRFQRWEKDSIYVMRPILLDQLKFGPAVQNAEHDQDVPLIRLYLNETGDVLFWQDGDSRYYLEDVVAQELVHLLG